ncbi:hypothetical protein ACIQWZ_36175 [Streptomyces sp. NPDC098077]|uniref:hypothetical protein n=1 Tax=Streptomyces sp. NPDC098077 TaxID=3366093 RepID=UPI0038138A61
MKTEQAVVDLPYSGPSPKTWQRVHSAARHHAGGLVGEAASEQRETSLIGEADSELGMTKHSISAADPEEALKENII